MSRIQRYNPLAWALFVAVYLPLVGPIVGTAGWGTGAYLENTRVLYRCSKLIEGGTSLDQLPDRCRDIRSQTGGELIPASDNVAAALWNSLAFTVSGVVSDTGELVTAQFRRHGKPLMMFFGGLVTVLVFIAVVLPDVFDHLKFWLTRLVLTIPIVIFFNLVGALITILGQAARVYFRLVWDGRLVLAGIVSPADALIEYRDDVGDFIRDALKEAGGIFKGVSP